MRLLSPFPYFGGKRTVAANVWARLGSPSQYIEPFCGSAAVLLAAPKPASLEVVNDASGFIANFWRAVKYQAFDVAKWADYPVSHIDLGGRHQWLMGQREHIGANLHDPNWPGDAKVAGWWLWGQCCWIGSGWCDWDRAGPARRQRRDGDTGDRAGDDATSAGMGIQAIGQVPHASDAGMGIQAIGQVPHASDAGRGIQAIGQVPHASDAGRGEAFLTSCGLTAVRWLGRIADRLERVRVVHGHWSRCLNNHFGGDDTAVFLDPPYRAYEKLYGNATPVADEVEAWARDNANLRVALCGHINDYDLPGWDVIEWSRGKLTYAGGKTTDKECVWYSPACVQPSTQIDMFSTASPRSTFSEIWKSPYWNEEGTAPA
jgi:DNA adenine methylase